MRTWRLLVAVALAVGTFGCQKTTEETVVHTTSCQPKLWSSTTPVQPPCTTALSITIDDSVNQVYSTTSKYWPSLGYTEVTQDLQWKGSFVYNPSTRMAFYDTNWGYGAPSAAVPLFDDGPWTAGGHEGEGSVAGDHKWGATIFVPTPTAEETWNYGLADAAFGFGWIWVGNAGAVTIPASSTTPIVATGQTFPPFGTIDLKLQVDLAALDPQFLASTVDLTQPKVKGSKWAWTLIPLTAEGGGIYTFLMSDFVGPGKEFSHTGLGETGDQIQFVFTFGATDKEYKVGSSGPPISGVTAWTSPTPGGTLSSASIQKQPSGDQNTFVTLP